MPGKNTKCSKMRILGGTLNSYGRNGGWHIGRKENIICSNQASSKIL